MPLSIAVTGAFGFIGSHLSRRLLRDGHRVIGIGLNPKGIALKGAEEVEGDIFGLDFGEILGRNPDVLVHLAGPASVGPSWQDLYAETYNSVLLTSFLLEKWRMRPSMSFLFVSSAGIYGDHDEERYSEDLCPMPLSPYGACKLASENLIRIFAEKHSLRYGIVRPFSIYGAGLKKQVVYDMALRFIRKENPLVIRGTGQEKRDFVSAEDCCGVISALCLSASGLDGLTVNIGTGRAVSIAHLADMLGKLTGHEGRHSFTGEDFPGNPKNLVADVSRLKQRGLSCDTQLEEGLKKVISFVREELK